MSLLRFSTLVFTVLLSALTHRGALAAPFEDTLAQRLQACTACHGAQGRAGPDGYYPRLAGKPAGYLYNQLINFREGRRHYGLMSGLVGTLNDAYLMEIAHYFSALELPYPKPVPSTAGAAVLERGKQLAMHGDAAVGLPACTQCHGTALTGVLPHTPGLLGLPRDYLNAQLGGWKTGRRHAVPPDCMADIARKISDVDANAVTQWLSSQAVPHPAMHARMPPPRTSATAAVQCGGEPVVQKALAFTPEGTQVQRGAYLARLGNCAACHTDTARGGAPFAGGLALETGFGKLRTSNLTPHPTNGIGAWSSEDFWQAMHHGKSRDGKLLYPAFPYTHYTHVAREDSDALLAYLRTLPTSDQPNQPHALRWPYNTQWALAVWRWLYFKPGPEIAKAPRSVDAERGSYLVKGLGHCSACHAPRNGLGATDESNSLSGGEVPGSHWLAPALTPQSLGTWSITDMVNYLTHGTAAQGNASGPMAEVVLGSTQYLSATDAQAMARYLLPNTQDALSARNNKQTQGSSVTTVQPVSGLGAKLYERHCASCHGASGQGVAGAYPALAGNSTVNAQRPNNLVQITVLGGFAPATLGNPRPFGMPPFQLQLNNSELSALLTYVRGAWGNSAAPTSELEVSKIRPSQSH